MITINTFKSRFWARRRGMRTSTVPTHSRTITSSSLVTKTRALTTSSDPEAIKDMTAPQLNIYTIMKRFQDRADMRRNRKHSTGRLVTGLSKKEKLEIRNRYIREKIIFGTDRRNERFRSKGRWNISYSNFGSDSRRNREVNINFWKTVAQSIRSASDVSRRVTPNDELPLARLTRARDGHRIE